MNITNIFTKLVRIGFLLAASGMLAKETIRLAKETSQTVSGHGQMSMRALNRRLGIPETDRPLKKSNLYQNLSMHDRK